MSNCKIIRWKFILFIQLYDFDAMLQMAWKGTNEADLYKPLWKENFSCHQNIEFISKCIMIQANVKNWSWEEIFWNSSFDVLFEEKNKKQEEKGYFHKYPIKEISLLLASFYSKIDTNSDHCNHKRYKLKYNHIVCPSKKW